MFDGFIIDCNFSNALNTFLKDISKGDNLFYYIFESKEYVNYIKKFIVNILNSSIKLRNWIEEDLHLMEALFDNKFYFRFTLPKTVVTQEKYEEFRCLGPDYLIGALYPEEIFEYLVPHLYAELSSGGILDLEELKDLGKHKIGLA